MIGRTSLAGALVGCALLAAIGAAPAGADSGDRPGSAARTTAQAAPYDTDWGTGRAGSRVNARAAGARTTTVAPSSGPDFEMPFGCGQSWLTSTRASHSPSRYATDFNAAGDLGKPVLASAPGTVVVAKSLTYSYGRYVVIDHGNGFTTLYAHMNGLAVSVGQSVDQGDLIGFVGSSGNSTGPHLHFEQRRNGAYFAPYFTRAALRTGSTVRSANCNDRPVSGDWDGNGRDDVGVYRSTPTTGQFMQRSAAGATTVLPWGSPNNLPAVGDYDGDHVAQVGVRRSNAGTWYLRSANGATAVVTGVGVLSDIPVVGDWDGNGRVGLGVYRSSTHTFWLRADNGRYSTLRWGADGQRPVVGDWDGDGRDEIGAFDPTTGGWSLRMPTRTAVTMRYGWAGDLPVVGDWNGDGRDEIGVWRPSTAQFWQRSPITTAATSTWFGYGARR